MNRKFQKETESSCEYILPDYLGDVRRVLTSSARVIPSGQFNQDGSIECAGIVSYELVYLDAENKVSSANFTSDYDFSFPIDMEIYLDSYIMSMLSNFSVRLAGPRRILAKSAIVSDICLSESKIPAVRGNAFEFSDNIEKIEKNIDSEVMLSGESIEREYAEEIASVEELTADEIEIITSNAYVRIEETTPQDGGVNIKGVLVINAIIKTQEMSTFAVRREIPFDETVEISGTSPDMSAISDVKVTSLVCSPVEFDGAVKINANVITEMKAALYYNEKFEIIKDAYVKTRDTESKYDNFVSNSHIMAKTASVVFNGKMKRTECGMRDVKEILVISCDFKSPAAEIEGHVCKISAEAYCCGIAIEMTDDGKENLIPLKFSAPVKADVNLSCQVPKDALVSIKISPAIADINIEADNVYLNSCPTLNLCVGSEHSERILSSCDVVGDAEYRSGLSTINVYYPEKKESLFDIAKKFHTTPASIAADNEISEAVASGGESISLASGFDKLIIR